MSDAEETPAVLTPMNIKQLAQVALVGAIVGLLLWGVAFILETYILRGILCPGSSTMRCAAGAAYAEGIATILLSAVGLFGLVKLQVFRSLLVVVATAASLWGFIGLQSDTAGYFVALYCAVFYLLGYVAFAWIARIRLFWLVALLMLLLVVGIRLMLSV